MPGPAVVVVTLVVRRGLLLAGDRLLGAGAPDCPFPAAYLECGEALADAMNRATALEAGVRCRIRAPHSHSSVWLTGRATLRRMDCLLVYLLGDWVAGQPHAPDPGQSVDWSWWSIGKLVESPWVPARWLASLRDRKRVALL